MLTRNTQWMPLSLTCLGIIALGAWMLSACASGNAPVDAEVDLQISEPAAESEALAPSDPLNDAQTRQSLPSEQTSCSAPASAGSKWYDDAIAYEIFVRSFKDSDGDGVGDFNGLKASLDYLNDGDPETSEDLGVDLLWLMPIHQSPSYHGYDVTDYQRVDEEYGSEEEFNAMLEAAEARGIRVIVDLVLNHSSSQHPWFLDAKTGANAAYRNFYVWSDSDLGWTQPWSANGTWHPTSSGYYYGLFWEGMPDLNFASQAVQATMTDIAKTWLERGIAGYRLDAVRYLVETSGGEGQKDTGETLTYWKKLREAVDSVNPEALLLGEAWADSAIVSAYFGEADAPSMHMAFDFEVASGIESALVNGHAGMLRSALCARLDGWPAHGSAGTFATNHDMRRLASRLKGADPKALYLVATMLMTLPGTPWIYYGQELGLQNGPTNDDIDKRLPMQWSEGPGVGFTNGTPWAQPKSEALAHSVEGQGSDPASLLSHYRSLIKLRRSTPALRRGSTRMLKPESTSGKALAFVRELEGETFLVLLNPNQDAVTLTFPEEDADALQGFERFVALEERDPEAKGDPTTGVDLPGFGFALMTR